MINKTSFSPKLSSVSFTLSSLFPKMLSVENHTGRLADVDLSKKKAEAKAVVAASAELLEKQRTLTKKGAKVLCVEPQAEEKKVIASEEKEKKVADANEMEVDAEGDDDDAVSVAGGEKKPKTKKKIIVRKDRILACQFPAMHRSIKHALKKYTFGHAKELRITNGAVLAIADEVQTRVLNLLAGAKNRADCSNDVLLTAHHLAEAYGHSGVCDPKNAKKEFTELYETVFHGKKHKPLPSHLFGN